MINFDKFSSSVRWFELLFRSPYSDPVPFIPAVVRFLESGESAPGWAHDVLAGCGHMAKNCHLGRPPAIPHCAASPRIVAILQDSNQTQPSVLGDTWSS